MIRTLLSLFCFTVLFQLSAQTYFYIGSILIAPNSPTTADNIVIGLVGGLSSTGASISSASATISGSTITVNITAIDVGGATVIVPHTEYLDLGMLTAGQWHIVINGTNADDFAPQDQHHFTVTGGGSVCDSLIFNSIQWHTFSDTAIVINVSNTSATELFNYPNFILFDANGDTLAIEVTNYFGIANESWHMLSLVDGAAIPQTPFMGTLELWTWSTSELSCTWSQLIDLCPASCTTVYPTIQNLGSAVTEGDFQWTITDKQGIEVENGIVTLPGSNEIDSDTICLAPGIYEMTCVPVGAPSGGQPFFTVIQTWMITSGSRPAYSGETLPFEIQVQCIDGTNNINPPVNLDSPIVTHRNGLIEIRNNHGLPLGPIALYSSTGQVITTKNAVDPYATISVRTLANGVYVLRVGDTKQKLHIEGY